MYRYNLHIDKCLVSDLRDYQDLSPLHSFQTAPGSTKKILSIVLLQNIFYLLRSLEAIRGHQRSLEVIRGHQRSLKFYSIMFQEIRTLIRRAVKNWKILTKNEGRDPPSSNRPDWFNYFSCTHCPTINYWFKFELLRDSSTMLFN